MRPKNVDDVKKEKNEVKLDVEMMNQRKLRRRMKRK